MQCSFKERKRKGRSAKNVNVHALVRCTKTAVWVIRKDGREFYACNAHKTEGVLVRKV